MAYVYRHIRLDKNEVFYIGYSSKNDNYKRAYQKLSRNKHWYNVVSKTDFEVEIICDEITWQEAKNKEIEFVALYGRADLGKGCLVNKTSGGDGVAQGLCSVETRKKISDANKAEKNHNYGKKLSDVTKMKLSKSLKGIIPPNKGKPMSEEQKKKLSEAQKGEKSKRYGKKSSYDTRKKLSEAQKGEKNHRYGKPMSEEQKKKISEKMKGRPSHLKGKKLSTETINKKNEKRKSNKLKKIQYAL
jgi:hypothetical protein